MATLTFLVCILTVWGKHSEQVGEEKMKKGVNQNHLQGPGQSPATPPAWSMMELVVMTFIR